MARRPRAEPVAEPEEFDDSESGAEAESDATGEDVEAQPPTGIDPYAVLEVSRDVPEEDIRKAYRKLALKHHPDKGGHKETFQSLAFAYAILSDPTRRSRYDVTGSTSESILEAEDDDFDWLSFYRSQFAQVITEEKLDKFKTEYQGGAEERRDLLAAYTKTKGNMDNVYERVMMSDVLEDDKRFRTIIDAATAQNEVEAFNRYINESDASKAKRIQKAKTEAARAEHERKKMEEKKSGSKRKTEKTEAGMGDLVAMIQKNQQKRGGFLDQLETKYGGKKRKKATMDEPPEEAFAANRVKGGKTKA